MKRLAKSALIFVALVLGALPARADVADKEPTVATLWFVALAIVAIAHALGRIRYWLSLAVWPAAAIWASALVLEFADPQIASSLDTENGPSYFVQYVLTVAVAILGPPASAWWWHQRARQAADKN